jgi:hypothetical protein
MLPLRPKMLKSLLNAPGLLTATRPDPLLFVRLLLSTAISEGPQ